MSLQTFAKPDVFSDMRVPFDVGVWARAHRYNVTVVNIAGAISRIDNLTKQLDDLEEKRTQEEQRLRDLCAEAQTKMKDRNE